MKTFSIGDEVEHKLFGKGIILTIDGFGDSANKFIYWYIHDYLCYDLDSTKRRLKECLPCL